MAVCSTCGNSSAAVCGCKDIALTMNCTDFIGLNCATDANQCASMECAECVISCGQENSWSAIGQSGENYVYFNGWSMIQYMQSTAVINASGLAAIMSGYFTLFTCPAVTSSTVQLQWSFLANPNIALPTSFQIEYREVVDGIFGDWILVANPPYGQTSYTVSATNTALTPGALYQFRIRSVDANGEVTNLDYQSVMLNITIPN